MRLIFGETEIEEIERQVDVDDFKTAYKLEVNEASIKIRCNLKKWERIKKTFLDWMWINIEEKYPDANYSLTWDTFSFKNNGKWEHYKKRIDGEYMTIYQPFVIGDEL